MSTPSGNELGEIARQLRAIDIDLTFGVLVLLALGVWLGFSMLWRRTKI